MTIKKIIKERRTIRKYKPDKVPRKMIKEALDAGRWAPSMHNMQPWKFIVVEGPTKKKLADALNLRKKNEPLVVRLVLKEGTRIIENAPTVILVYRDSVFKKRKSHTYNNLGTMGGKILGTMRVFETQSIAAAIQNILLQFHAKGVGAAWLGAALFRERAINKLIGTEDELMALLTVGFPDETGLRSKRKPLLKILTFKE
ncbi:MAG: nitroreductase family protein [Candidatus Aadella gelida]|nr:nitroreductase family protein [Candidatus Aadella gelida]